MSSGKKGKKSKEKKVSLQEFLATTPSSGGTTQVVIQKSWAEECEDDDDRPSRPEFIELPTAPRAARILEDDSIPHQGPFCVRVSNLPFDMNEDDIDEFFADRNIRVKEMRLAKDEQNDRLRGYGFVEFVDREDLINALMCPDATIRNRRIRIEVANENDMRSDGRSVRKRYDNYTPRDGANESTNWRDRKESQFESVDGSRRDRFQQRSHFQNRHDSNNNDNSNGEGSNWRLGDRPNDSPPPERRRNNFGDRRVRERYDRRDTDEERPVLNLQPRTKPLPVLTFPKEEELDRPNRKPSSLNGDAENHNDSGLADDEEKETASAAKPKPVPSAAIFGEAKPVDTAAREREIEAKLEQEREAKLQSEKEEREKSQAEDREQAPVKDVIVIKTEKARQQEEAVNWRKHEEPSNEPAENRNRDNGRRFGDGDRRGDRRTDDRPRQFNKDSRERNYNNRDFRNDRNMGSRGGIDRRDNNRRDVPRRDGQMEIRREEPKEPKEPREPRQRNPEGLPKYQAPAGPNLHVSNAFAGLDDEVDAD